MGTGNCQTNPVRVPGHGQFVLMGIGLVKPKKSAATENPEQRRRNPNGQDNTTLFVHHGGTENTEIQ